MANGVNVASGVKPEYGKIISAASDRKRRIFLPLSGREFSYIKIAENGGSRPALLQAVAAINGAIVLGDEGKGTFCAALGANRRMLDPLAAAAGRLVAGPAGLAAGGLVLEALFGVEFLLACGEYEFAAAILAYQSLVFKHGSLPLRVFWLKPADLVFDPTLACWRVRY